MSAVIPTPPQAIEVPRDPLGLASVSGVTVEGLREVGPDGAVFQGRDEEGREVEVWRLQRADAALRRRIDVLARSAQPAKLPILSRAIDGETPHLVVPAVRWGDPDAWADDAEGLRRQIHRLALALDEAHRWDVVHGALGASHVGRGANGLVLDLTGLAVRPPAPVELAPEHRHTVPTSAADVWALGTILGRGSRVAGEDPEIAALVARMTQEDAEARPTAAEVAQALTREESATLEDAREAASEGGQIFPGIPRQLGAYRLTETLGAGGMGRVYRAEDRAGGPDVAVKVLLPGWAKSPDIVARFRREARLLAQLQSPYVARYVSAHEQSGVHYLVMELARGSTASALHRERGRLDADLAVAIVGDTARALSEVHQLGLVHRDVKPANLIVDLEAPDGIGVKLCDFGIAREEHSMEPEDELTTDGAPGTPSYMAPEQVDGRSVDARTDVYALGVTLYELLAGQPPFKGAAHFIMVAHLTEPPPPITSIEPSVPADLAAVVMRCLEKDPRRRYDDAGAFLGALEEAVRGAEATTSITLPQAIGIDGEPKAYDFEWALDAPPEALWPHVSNTERLNRAAGLDDVEWAHQAADEDGGYVRTTGSFRAAGMELRWKENPFEWVAPRRLGVVREYVSGPFEWLRSTVELDPREGGGTTLRHRIEIRPRGLFGRVAATVEVGLRLRRGLDRVYRNIDAACRAAGAVEPADPFEGPEATRGAMRAIDALLPKIVEAGVDPHVAHALTDYVASAPGPTVARIRPKAWARERGIADDVALDAMLVAAHEGLLELMWDLLCPKCRVPATIEKTLAALEDHGHCEVCAIDFELDMARSVELVFRAHPSVRTADLGIYCIGGPAHSPHVVAQVRLTPGERFALELSLGDGRYAVTGRGLPTSWSFAVDPRAPFSTWDLPLRAGASASAARTLSPGRQVLSLANDLDREVVVRVERAGERDDAVTAADAACSARFRALYPEQVLSPERLVAVSNAALLFASVPEALRRFEEDEAAVHRELVALSTLVEDCAALQGGALVKLHGNGVMAVFSDRVAAVRAAMEVARRHGEATLAVHAGPARMTTIGGRLDYFGRTLHVGEHMGRHRAPGELLLSEPLLTDPALAELIAHGAVSRGYLQVGSMLVGRYEVMPAVSA